MYVYVYMAASSSWAFACEAFHAQFVGSFIFISSHCEKFALKLTASLT